jgi:hypothetical protein
MSGAGDKQETFADYTKIEAENWSTLKHALKSWQHYADAKVAPRKDTPAMLMGRATHCAVLEPDTFPLRYVVLDDGYDWPPSRATKIGKAEWAAYQERHPDCGDPTPAEWRAAIFAETNPGKDILTATQYVACLSMRDAVRSHPIAGPLLDMGAAEQVIEWAETVPFGLGTVTVFCKGRLDWLRAARVFVDLKTTRAVKLHHFAGQAEALGTFHQFAWYRRGLAAIEKCSRDAVITRVIAVENVRPWSVAVREPDWESLDTCDVEIDALLRGLVACRESGKWPGPSETEIESMRRPKYAMPEESAIDDLMFEEHDNA